MWKRPADQACEPECRSGPGPRIGEMRRRISTEARAEAALTGGDRSEGRRDRTCGNADLREGGLRGLGRPVVAALKSDALQAEPTKCEGAKGLVPAGRSWPPRPGLSAARKGAASRPRRPKMRKPGAPRPWSSMPPKAVLRRGSSHREQASGSWKATGARQQCRAFFCADCRMCAVRGLSCGWFRETGCTKP